MICPWINPLTSDNNRQGPIDWSSEDQINGCYTSVVLVPWQTFEQKSAKNNVKSQVRAEYEMV